MKRAALEFCVVILAQNARRFVHAALASIAQQTVPPHEIVVADDGSRDSSAAVARECGAIVISADYPSESAAARNRGVAATTSPVSAFLDADDEWKPDHAERLIGAIRGAVELVGPIPAQAVTRMYADTDIFALPSFAEGVPVVLMEAMAMERPCLSSNLMGIPELIENGVNGVLIRPADLDDLVRGLRLLLDDPALRRRMGVAARQRVVRDYNLQINVARLADFLVPA